ncbi:hypothetical protein QFZ54_002065 [Sphingomonas faeni]|nr:hypothetical protein [Sphingomonas faeni]
MCSLLGGEVWQLLPSLEGSGWGWVGFRIIEL